MSLTRKMLKAMGIEEEKIDQIIEAHSETVDSLKADRDSYKEDAEKLKAVQKELDDLKAKGDDGWKEMHDRLKVEFEHSYEPTGPFGAKSIGEIVINTPAPAIAHAIYRATGVWHRELPITPEKILMAQK